MTTKQVVVAVTQTRIVLPDNQRTVLTLANTDNANTIYVSDSPGIAVGTGYPIFPETYISLLRKDGDEPQKAWYGITAVQSTIAVMEQFGTIAQEVPDPEPNPQEPYSPIDAPIMVPLRMRT